MVAPDLAITGNPGANPDTDSLPPGAGASPSRVGTDLEADLASSCTNIEPGADLAPQALV
jgi:hypothetical protein